MVETLVGVLRYVHRGKGSQRSIMIFFPLYLLLISALERKRKVKMIS